jgi:hypothetical protein
MWPAPLTVENVSLSYTVTYPPTWELTYQGLHSLLIFNGSWDNHSRVPVTGTFASTSPLFVTPTPNSQHLTSRFTFVGSNKQARGGGGSNPALNQSMPRHVRTTIQTKFEKRCHPTPHLKTSISSPEFMSV